MYFPFLDTPTLSWPWLSNIVKGTRNILSLPEVRFILDVQLCRYINVLGKHMATGSVIFPRDPFVDCCKLG
jgi:hypothetical protein